MDGTADRRGILYPAKLPQFFRFPPGEKLTDRVYWFWAARWEIAKGRTSRQEILPFPCMNLVVQQEGVTLSGVVSGASHRDLSGSGWVVAALLRPACTPAFDVPARQILGDEMAVAAAELHQNVCELMVLTPTARNTEAAANVLSEWISEHIASPDTRGQTANRMLDVVAKSKDITNVVQLAQALNLSVRSLQRLADEYVGLSPLQIIRCYRLQEAAHQLRESPQTSIALIAAQLEYADHAHLDKDFRRVLGFSPRDYRARSTPK